MRNYVITRTAFNKRGNLFGVADIVYDLSEARDLYNHLKETLSPRGYTAIKLEQDNVKKPLFSHALSCHKAKHTVKVRVA